MGKRLFLLFITSIIGVVMTPGFLMATDEVAVTGIDNDGVVETVLLPEPEPEPEPTPAPQPVVTKAPSAGAARAPRPAAPQIKNYNVTIVTNQIVGGNLSYSDIYRTGKFIYAHNTSGLLGNLPTLAAGEVFTITENGVTRSYRVAYGELYEKAANGYLRGSREVTYEVEIEAKGHSIVMMTCAGTPLGGGDATHRYVVFADAI